MIERRQTTLRFIMMLLSALLTAPDAHADIAAGDKPSLHFNSFPSGSAIDLVDLRGKIVVVDFWAAWCEPCVAQAEHLARINEQYAGKGLQLITVSLDSDPTDLTSALKGKTFSWPIASEIAGWNSPIPREWGVGSLPQTFVIAPDGVVLWRGHPKNLDSVLADAFKQHPPQLLDSKALATVLALLSQIEAAIAANKPGEAVKLLLAIPAEVRGDSRIAGRLEASAARLQDFAKAQFAQADALIAEKKYAEASTKLEEVQKAFEGYPASGQARERLAQLENDPGVKAHAAMEQRLKESNAAFATALQTSTRDAGAATLMFKQIIKDFPNTPAAEKSTAWLAEQEASSQLRLGDSAASIEQWDKARTRYQSVLDRFPNTQAAKEARKKIDRLPK